MESRTNPISLIKDFFNQETRQKVQSADNEEVERVNKAKDRTNTQPAREKSTLAKYYLIVRDDGSIICARDQQRRFQTHQELRKDIIGNTSLGPDVKDLNQKGKKKREVRHSTNNSEEIQRRDALLSAFSDLQKIKKILEANDAKEILSGLGQCLSEQENIAHELILYLVQQGLEYSRKIIIEYITSLKPTSENLTLAEGVKDEITAFEMSNLNLPNFSSKLAQDTLKDKKIWTESCDRKLENMKKEIEEASRLKEETKTHFARPEGGTTRHSKNHGGARKKSTPTLKPIVKTSDNNQNLKELCDQLKQLILFLSKNNDYDDEIECVSILVNEKKVSVPQCALPILCDLDSMSIKQDCEDIIIELGVKKEYQKSFSQRRARALEEDNNLKCIIEQYK